LSARSILEARARGEREADIAAQLLGRDHALVQTLGLLAVLTRQSLVVGGVLVVAVSTGFAVGAAQASSVVIAASIVELVLILGIRVLIRIKRRQARCLIIQGSGALPLKSVAAERRALLDPSAGARLADSLEQILHAAESYEHLLVASRPPPSATRRLCEISSELRCLASDLRAGRLPCRGVAIAAQLLDGGYASPVYNGRVEEARTVLTQINYERDSGSLPLGSSTTHLDSERTCRGWNRRTLDDDRERNDNENDGVDPAGRMHAG
jgi:hypothetical protein